MDDKPRVESRSVVTIYQTHQNDVSLNREIRGRLDNTPGKDWKIRVFEAQINHGDARAKVSEEGVLMFDQNVRIPNRGTISLSAKVQWLQPTYELRPFLYKNTYKTICMPFGEIDRIYDGKMRVRQLDPDETIELDEGQEIRYKNAVIGHSPSEEMDPEIMVDEVFEYNLCPLSKLNLANFFRNHRENCHPEIIQSIFVRTEEYETCRIILNNHEFELTHDKNANGAFIDFTKEPQNIEEYKCSLMVQQSIRGCHGNNRGLHENAFDVCFLEIFGKFNFYEIAYESLVLLDWSS